MATEQCFYALVAADRSENGKSSLYRMNDVVKNTAKPNTNINKSKADDSVNVPGVTAPGTTFSDIKNHANKAAIEELASRGIINGMSKDTFAPNKTMTRAEFAAIVTRALGLAAKDTKAFTDVPSSSGTLVTLVQQTAAALSTVLAAASLTPTAPSPGKKPQLWSRARQSSAGWIPRWMQLQPEICWRSLETIEAPPAGQRRRWRSAIRRVSSTRVTSIFSPQKPFCAARSRRCSIICWSLRS